MDYKSITDEQIINFLKTQHGIKIWLEKILEIQIEDEELYGPLRNGVVLCFLMQALDPGSIPRINMDARDFKYKENIEFFTAALVELGVPFYKVFSVNDLFEGDGTSKGNIVNVVTCLAEMARVVAEQFDGAPTLEECMDAAWAPPALDAKRMTGLKKMQARVRTGPPRGTKVKVSSLVVQKKLQLMAGNGTDINKYTHGFVRFQALVRGHLARKKYKTMVRNQAYRDHVAREILSTERVYVEALRTVVEVFLRPLQKGVQPPGAKKRKKPLLSEDEVIGIFSEIEQILMVNEELLGMLEARVAKWGPSQCLGDIFLKLAEYLKVYTPFVQNFNSAMTRLEQLEKRKDLARFLVECKAVARTNRLDLPSFLIMPIQRIPRYNMLLTDITKHTWEGHPDLENLQKAVDKIGQIAQVINEKKREAENMQRMLQISRTITGKGVEKLNLAEPHRRLILEGSFNKATKAPLSLYLLSDMVLICSAGKKGAGVALKDAHKITVVDVSDADAAAPGSLDLIKYGTGKVIVRLQADSPAEAEKWRQSLRRVRAEEKEARNIKDQFAQKKKAFVGVVTSGALPTTARGGARTQLTAEQQLRERAQAAASKPENSVKSPLELAMTKKQALEDQVARLEAQLADKKHKWKKGEKEAAKERLTALQPELDEAVAALSDLEADEAKKVKRRSGRPVSVAYGGSPLKGSGGATPPGSPVVSKGRTGSFDGGDPRRVASSSGVSESPSPRTKKEKGKSPLSEGASPSSKKK